MVQEAAGRKPTPTAVEVALPAMGGHASLGKWKGLLLVAIEVQDIWEFQIFRVIHPNICIATLRALLISNHSPYFMIENHLPPVVMQDLSA